MTENKSTQAPRSAGGLPTRESSFEVARPNDSEEAKRLSGKTGEAGGQRRAKKPYHTPKLTVYGNLPTITRTLGTQEGIDGGRAPSNRAGGQPQAKKPYHTPKLTVYGNLPTITGTLGTQGASDGGHAALNRTH
jgi:hypothetical protein